VPPISRGPHGLETFNGDNGFIISLSGLLFITSRIANTARRPSRCGIRRSNGASRLRREICTRARRDGRHRSRKIPAWLFQFRFSLKEANVKRSSLILDLSTARDVEIIRSEGCSDVGARKRPKNPECGLSRYRTIARDKSCLCFSHVKEPSCSR